MAESDRADLQLLELPLVVKSADPTGRKLAGMASTPDVDVHGQIIDPLGVTYTNPAPLLLQHDPRIPIGTVIFGTPTSEGVPFSAEIPELSEAGDVKRATDRAAHLLKYGLIRKVSVGLQPLAFEPLRDGLVRITKAIFHELSLVTVPANRHAAITVVKSAAPAPKGPAMKQTTAEQISAFENKRAALSARQVDLMAKAADAGQTLSDEESTEYDALGADLAKCDAHLVRLRALEQSQKAAAVPVDTKTAMPFKPGIITVKANVEPWVPLIRYAKAMYLAGGIKSEALSYAAKEWRDSTPEVELAIKAAVAAGTTTDATWAGPLAPLKPLSDGFLSFLRPKTIVGRVPNFRRTPFNTSIPAQTGGGTYSWVGQGAPKPVTKLTFGTTSLGITKAAAIIVITEELARNSSPSAEQIIRDDMVAGLSQFVDAEFVDPTKAPVNNVSPGSVTNGVTPITSAGTSPANARTDISALIAQMTVAGLSVSEAVLIMSESNAAVLSNTLNPLGQPLFPSLNAMGGTALGIPVIASQTAGANVILAHAPSILLAEEGVTIDASREASVQMDSAPAGTPDATTVYTSFWQMNYVGLRGEYFITWKKARAGAVSYTVQTYVG